MKASIGLVSVFLVGSAMAWPMYKQTVVTPKGCNELKPLILPPGKTRAFTTRWDDTNPRHANMSQMLAKNGFKASFYLNSVANPGIEATLQTILSNGGSVGAHTCHHPFLPLLKPEFIWREILLNRIEIEVKAQSPVNVFTLPYCAATSQVEPRVGSWIGQALSRAGFVGGPETRLDHYKIYGLTTNTWVDTCLFAVNDRTPDPKLFESGLAKYERTKAVNPSGPHLTLGIHTWQNDAQLERLSAIIALQANLADTWYCNETEYAAYRLQMLNTRVISKKETSNGMEWTILRPEPWALGAALPLYFDGGYTAEVTKEHQIPSKFVKSDSAKITLKDNVAQLRMTLPEALKDINVRILPPLMWENSSFEDGIRMNASSGMTELALSMPLGVRRDEPDFATTNALFGICVDGVNIAGNRIRVWSTVNLPLDTPANLSKNSQAHALNHLQSCCRIAGPLDAETVKIEQIDGTDLGHEEWQKFHKLSDFPENASYAFDLLPAGTQIHRQDDKTLGGRMLMRALQKDSKRVMISVFDLDSKVVGEELMVKFAMQTSGNATFALNGLKVTPSEPLKLRKGLNRLVIITPASERYHFKYQFKLLPTSR